MAGAVALVLLLAGTADPATETPITVSLAIPSRERAARIQVDNPSAHFHVLLSSQTSAPLRVWDDTFSWGYYALSFEVVDGDGAHVVRKRKVGFTRNAPAWWLLSPSSHLVLDVYLGDGRLWEGLPSVSSGCRAAQVRAVFEVAPDDESDKERVWTGRVVSDVQEVLMCK